MIDMVVIGSIVVNGHYIYYQPKMCFTSDNFDSLNVKILGSMLL